MNKAIINRKLFNEKLIYLQRATNDSYYILRCMHIYYSFVIIVDTDSKTTNLWK